MRQVTSPRNVNASMARDGSGAMAGESDDDQIVNPKSQSVAVGADGRLITGTSPDGRTLGVLFFTQGNAASSIQFQGAANDPVPVELVGELGQAQVTAIKNQLGS